ncbi:hypothetical protein FRC01_013494 [Tulasnella sp. 417]|nr:hypothetical protein FRC01_013494 [Tulasnella sp. 417]
MPVSLAQSPPGGNTPLSPNQNTIEKYYAPEAYEKHRDTVRAGETLPLDDARADMAAHKASTTRKGQADDSETYLSRELLMELRKVQNERAQVGKMKLLGLDVNFGSGWTGTPSNKPTEDLTSCGLAGGSFDSETG